MKRAGLILAATVIAATALFYAALHQISSLWMDVALSPDVQRALERSMEDQKTLRRLDAAQREAYRRRFEETQRLLNRIEVIRMNRHAMLQRFELALLAVFALAASTAAIAAYGRYRVARDRDRRRHLERLSGWQEAARRHAHEIKGPLTAIRLEVDRLTDLARSHGAAGADRLVESIDEELNRLAGYVREFSSFGALGQPVLRRESLLRILEEFRDTFAGAWPNLAINVVAGREEEIVCADRDMLRQVLVNLCANSARAAGVSGAVTLTILRESGRIALDVSDDGCGIPPALVERVFEPYVTTRPVGEGIGLGLALSRKIMLDHGGDLAIVATSARGTTFRMTFGESSCN